MEMDDLHLWVLALHSDTREREKEWFICWYCAVIVENKLLWNILATDKLRCLII